ncbi:MAG: acyl transferase [Bacteroidota bacterium]
MLDARELKKKILNVDSDHFVELALRVFQYQYRTNLLYKEFVDLLKIRPESVQEVGQIPFLPIQFFKTHRIQSGNWKPEVIYSSSGTSGLTTSRHLVRSESFYLKNCQQIFERFYGPIKKFAVLALLPAYLEREGSSLVSMANHFIDLSERPESGFFLYEHEVLLNHIAQLQKAEVPTLLLGVSFALWDLAEAYPTSLGQTIIMETGGMKGRRKEITRKALHQIFSTAFQVPTIHSEYGMTELLSQVYSDGNGLFTPVGPIRIRIRELTDPFNYLPAGKTGGINIIDLANLDSCAFLATDDIGQLDKNGRFQVLGRIDNSDIRGCNLLIQ